MLGVSSVPVKAVDDVPLASITKPFETFEELVIDRDYINPLALESIGEYTIRQYGYVDGGSEHYGPYTYDFYPYNDTVEKTEVRNGYVSKWLCDAVAGYQFSIVKSDGLPILLAGETASLRFDNVYLSIYFDSGNLYFRDATVKVMITYSDGSVTAMLPVTYTHSGAVGSFTLKDFKAEKDVASLKVFATFDDFADYGFPNSTAYYQMTFYYGEWGEGTNFVITKNLLDESTGLLATIIEWLRSIRDGISGIVSEIYSGFSYVINQLTELPALIWEKIEEGIKFLFLPTEEYIVNYKKDMDILLADKFGAVYEVVNLTFESWDRITANDEQNIISVEEVTIPLPDDNEFTFGGYDVPIVPSGFEWLATSVKTVVGIVCTVAFVNGLRKRYDEIMRG